MRRKVAITGIGLVSPIGAAVGEFLDNLTESNSGITYNNELEKKNFVCRVAGIPQYDGHNDELIRKYFPLDCDKAIKYAVSAGIDAWLDAGFVISDMFSSVTNDVSVVVGSTCAGYDYFSRVKNIVDEGRVKKLGSWFVSNTMHSGPAAFLSGILGASGRVVSLSSACASGIESLDVAYNMIVDGQSDIVLAGGCDPDSPYVWAGFDAMHLLCRNGNENPESASRPMSDFARGFVPSAGAGMLVLENMEHAKSRGARIYAEIVGSCVNSGGQRNGGSMTFPNSDKAVECIRKAICMAGIDSDEVKYINGHLSSTTADSVEVANWCKALSLKNDFPYINSTKSLFGHALGAAGALETIATILQMCNGFVHASINCTPLHAEISNIYDSCKIPVHRIGNVDIDYAAKASFGFGDVNACLILKSYK